MLAVSACLCDKLFVLMLTDTSCALHETRLILGDYYYQ